MGSKILPLNCNCLIFTNLPRFVYKKTSFILFRVGKLGYNLQLLTPISSPISWLFAQPSKGAENGFSISGGYFNYTADITFPETGHSAQVKYIFKVTLIWQYNKKFKKFTY